MMESECLSLAFDDSRFQVSVDLFDPLAFVEIGLVDLSHALMDPPSFDQKLKYRFIC